MRYRNLTRKRKRKHSCLRGGKTKKDTPSPHEFLNTINEEQRKMMSDNSSPVSANRNDFNNNIFKRESHNCYTYFLNMLSKEAMELCKEDFEKHNMCRRAQPGYASGFPNLSKSKYTCDEIEKRTLKDNPEIYKIKSKDVKCDKRFYKGAMVVAPERDYHYYRLNDEGVWTHKPGYKHSTKLDARNHEIKDPETADRNYGGTLDYKNFCGYYCVPRNENRKKMAHSTNWRKGLMNHYNTEKKDMTQHEKLLKKFKVKPKTNDYDVVVGKTAHIAMTRKLHDNRLKLKGSRSKMTRKKR